MAAAATKLTKAETKVVAKYKALHLRDFHAWVSDMMEDLECTPEAAWRKGYDDLMDAYYSLTIKDGNHSLDRLDALTGKK
jgi:hypothetical protein